MSTYSNNGFISYWRRLRARSAFDNQSWHSRILGFSQTATRLLGLVLKDAGIELFFLLVFGLIMTKMGQGRDLVVSFFEPHGIYSEWRVLYTVLSVIMFSVSMWIIPAFLFQIRDRKTKRNTRRSIFKEHLFFTHRVLPLIPFWLLAYVVFNGKYVAFTFIVISLVQLTLLFIFNNRVKEFSKRIRYFIAVCILFLIVVVVFVNVYQQTYYTAKVVFAILLYLVSFLLYFIFHEVDRQIIEEHSHPDDTTKSVFSKYKVNTSFYIAITIIHLVSVAVIFAAPQLFTMVKIAPESMLLYIFSLNIFLIDLFTYLINITPQLKFAGTAVIIIILLVYLSPLAKLNLRHYQIDQQVHSSVLKDKERLTFDERYAILRDSIINYKGPGEYPIILVSGEGGGSRAGMWFSQNLINFDKVTRGAFRNHIFSISSVSGSSVGLGTVFSFWEKTGRTNTIEKQWDSLPSKVFANNFVGSSIRGFLLTDFWKTIIPGNWTSDRNSVLQDEESYYTERACREILSGKPWNDWDSIPVDQRILSRDFMSFFYDTIKGKLSFKRDVPLVFVNACRSNDGRRGIFSPIRLSNDVFSDAIDLNGYLYDSSVRDVNGKILCKSAKSYVSLGQVCNTSELFPIFSTPAYIDSLGSFVDGGYHENSGLKTTLDIYEKLRYTLERDSCILKSKATYKIYIVYLKNGSTEKNLYKGFHSEPPLTLPLKALSSQPFEGSASYFEERARFVGRKDNLVEFVEVDLDNHKILDTTYLFRYKGQDTTLQKEMLKDLKAKDNDTTLNFPLARWLSQAVVGRIKSEALSQLKDNLKLKQLIAMLNTDSQPTMPAPVTKNPPDSTSNTVVKRTK